MGSGCHNRIQITMNALPTDTLIEVDALTTAVGGPFTFCVKQGEGLGVSGPSGSGKSLLLRAIADLDPHGGTVRVEGKDCEAMTAPSWRRQVGLLPAESAWWHALVGDHFTACEELNELLAALGFTEAVLEWSVTRCSTGERQRLALARLLLNQPKVLLLDEPTASLDRDNVGRVEQVIAEYRATHHAAVIWVSHDATQLERVADRLIYLNGESQRSVA